MKQKDVAILFVVTLAILVSLYYQGSYYALQLTWVHPIDASLYKNGRFPQEHETLPAPLITDVDGDGHNEVVVVTTDSTIKILEGMPLGSSSSLFGSPTHFQNLPTKEEASLLPSVGVGAGRKPVALGSGYLSKYQEGVVRKQVIVVLTDGWTVLLFDNQLKLLWESTVRESLPPQLYHSEAALVVAPVPVRIGDAGVIVAAARLSRKQSSSPRHDHGVMGARKAFWMQEDEARGEDEEHFSYYAFDGRTGALRWKHEANDFYDEDDTEYSERIGEERAMHLGEMSWNDFRHSLMQQLPHSWFRREDTQMRVAHFERGPQQAAETGTRSQISGMHVDIPGLMWGGHVQHSEDDFIDLPNVIVAHFADGIEVIHLYTGRPVTHLGLERAVIWDDIDGDDVIESVRLTSLPRPGGSTPDECWALAQSGLPPQEDVFNVSVCDPKPQGILELLTAGTRRRSRDLPRVRSANPISVSRLATWKDPAPGKDMVFMVSDGRITSFSKHGHLNWMIDTKAEWSSIEPTPLGGLWNGKYWVTRPQPFPLGLPIAPSLKTFSPYSYHGHEEGLILGVGGSAMVIVSKDGNLLGEAELNEPPIARPAVGDFNNDGTNDIIIVATNAYYGYSLSTQTASLFLPTILFFVLLAIALLAVYQRRHEVQTAPRPKKRDMRHNL